MPTDIFGLSAEGNNENNFPSFFNVVLFGNKLLFSITFLLFGLTPWWIFRVQVSRWSVGSSAEVERIQCQVWCKKWICKCALSIDGISDAIIQNEDNPPYALSVVVASFPFGPNASPRRWVKLGASVILCLEKVLVSRHKFFNLDMCLSSTYLSSSGMLFQVVQCLLFLQSIWG